MSKKAVTRTQAIIILIVVIVAATGALFYASRNTCCAPPQPIRKSIITIGTTDKVTSLDPAAGGGYFGNNIMNNVGSGLLAYQQRTNTIIPDLATTWTISSDGKTYTFNLRKDAKFSNGDPITAQTVIDSWTRVMKINGPNAFLLTSEIDAKNPQSLTSPDAYTLVVQLTKPYSPFLSLLALSAAPTYVVDPKVVNMTGFFTGPYIGSGPYLVTKWVTDVELDLAANPNYYGPAPLTPNIVIKFFSDPSTLALAVQSKQVDVAFRSLDPTDIKSFRTNPNVKVVESDGAVMRYMAFNNRIPPFDNKLVRQALTYAINRTTIINSVFLGTVSPAYSMIPNGVLGHTDAYKTKYGPDGNPAMTKQLLTQAGYSTTNPLKIDFWYTPTHYGGTEQSVVTVIKQEFESTGMIVVTLHSAEWATYRSSYLNKINLPVLMIGWFPDYIDPDDYVAVMYNSRIARFTGTWYNNTRVDQLLQTEVSTTDTNTRLTALSQIQDTAADETPSVPLWQEKQIAVSQTGVSGIILDSSQIFRFWTLQSSA